MQFHRQALGLIFLLLTIAVQGAVGISRADIDNVLKSLDGEITVRDNYLTARRERIDSIKQTMKLEPELSVRRAMLLEALGREYASYENDSALIFFDRARSQAAELGADSLVTVIDLRRATYMPLAGFYTESERILNSMDTTAMSPAMKVLYHDAGRQAYSYTSSYFRHYPDIYSALMARSTAHQVGLLSALTSPSPLRQLNQGELFFRKREYAKAVAVLTDLIEKLSIDDNLYARAANLMAHASRERGDNDAYLYYLALSAISDIKGGTLEVASLQELGKKMFEADDVSRAHAYLMLAHKNAVECHALLRVFESSESMPLIESAHSIELNRGRAILVGILVVMAFMLLGMVVLVMILRRDMRRLHRLQERLRDANRVKEIYISQFLNLCSIYMDKLNQFCKVAHRKISTGKVDDLYKLTKSGKFVEEQSREFYEVFDEAFLHIYPTFVTDVNALLRPDSRIELKEGEKLNTDLRILAFMRLGIEESTRIAQVLNYSVYTIYTYRNKLKNRANNRETFEAAVMKIGSIEE